MELYKEIVIDELRYIYMLKPPMIRYYIHSPKKSANTNRLCMLLVGVLDVCTNDNRCKYGRSSSDHKHRLNFNTMELQGHKKTAGEIKRQFAIFWNN